MLFSLKAIRAPLLALGLVGLLLSSAPDSAEAACAAGGAVTCTPLANGTGTTASGVSVNLNPASASIIGGVKSTSSVFHQWVAYCDTTGTCTQSQPAFTDISGTISTAQIAASAVTLAKIANAAANSKLLGAGASGSGSAYAEITLGTNLSMSGTTLNATGGGGGTGCTTSGTSILYGDNAGGCSNAATGSYLSFSAGTLDVVTGTSGAAIPLLNGNNTHSGTENYTGAVQYGGNAVCPAVAELDITYTGGGTRQDIPATNKIANLTGTLAASLSIGLPPASTYAKNCILTVTDTAGTVSGSHTATIVPTNGTDTLNKLSSYPAILTPHFSMSWVSDGVSNWQTVSPATALSLASGQMYVGSAGNQTTPATMSGDCSNDNALVITCLRTNGTLFGTAATQNTGGSGATIPLNNGTNTHSGTDDFTGTFKINGTQLGLGTLTDTKFCTYTGASHTLVCNTSSTTGSIEVTDGTTDLTAAAKITFTGCVVSGSNPNAAVNCTGGGGILAVASGGTNAANGSGAAKNLSHPYVVCDAANTGGGVAAATVSGTTTETIIWQCKIPAGLMTANGRMSLIFQDAFGGALSANSKSLKFYFGTLGTTGDTSISSASLTTISSTASGQMGYLSILSQGSTSSQWLTTANGNANIVTGTLNTTSFNMTTTPIFLTVTGTLSSAANSAGESIAAKYSQLVLFPDGGN